MDNSAKQESAACCFCSKHRDQVDHLVAGRHNLYICDGCVDRCYEIIQEHPAARAAPTESDQTVHE
jgi:ATP-dependent protease Clp ATPase subunit